MHQENGSYMWCSLAVIHKYIFISIVNHEIPGGFPGERLVYPLALPAVRASFLGCASVARGGNGATNYTITGLFHSDINAPTCRICQHDATLHHKVAVITGH